MIMTQVNMDQLVVESESPLVDASNFVIFQNQSLYTGI